MPVEFETIDETTRKLIEGVLFEHHVPLQEAKLKWDGQFVVAKGEEPAITVSSRPIFGKVIFIKPFLRARKQPDVLIALDKRDWIDANVPQREAMIDELLQGIEICMTKATDSKPAKVMYDQAGRPRLTKRRHDLFLSSFADVVKRHKEDAPAVRTVQALHQQYSQLGLFNCDMPAATPKMIDAPAVAPSVEAIDKDKNKRKGKKKK